MDLEIILDRSSISLLRAALKKDLKRKLITHHPEMAGKNDLRREMNSETCKDMNASFGLIDEALHVLD
jgi:2-oxo-4-hydroxy-4-carboxy--5-ureidoimidazoline (OHCU) decarboxylase